MDVDKNYEKRGRVEVYLRSKSDSAAKKVHPHSRFLKIHFLAHQFFAEAEATLFNFLFQFIIQLFLFFKSIVFLLQ